VISKTHGVFGLEIGLEAVLRYTQEESSAQEFCDCGIFPLLESLLKTILDKVVQRKCVEFIEAVCAREVCLRAILRSSLLEMIASQTIQDSEPYLRHKSAHILALMSADKEVAGWLDSHIKLKPIIGTFGADFRSPRPRRESPRRRMSRPHSLQSLPPQLQPHRRKCPRG
jgi:hypothetical protein